MADRRSFLAGMLAAGIAPQATWANAGRPSMLSAAKKPDGSYVLCGLRADGAIAFEVPLPARGHAAAAHPIRAQAVAFARRPGTYAVVLDCASAQTMAWLKAPDGRHFYGHGAYSAAGDLLFTTENDYNAARGIIGIWDARNSYRRIGEFSSGGVGPHDVKLMPDGQTLVIANGGIETHPESGRTKLNIPTMRPNLTYASFDGHVQTRLELPEPHRKNSIRHLAVSRDGRVAFAMQWQGDLNNDLPLLGLHHSVQGTLHLLSATTVRPMRGYLGSVAFAQDGQSVAVTAPRSGRAHIYRNAELVHELKLDDVCGVVSSEDGFLFTTGNGLARRLGGATRQHPLAWDNHLVAI